MPTRKPKRTNWKKAYADLVNATVALVTKWEEQIKSLESRLNSALSDCAAEHQARLAAERHNAELLKEREAPVKPCADNCHDCNIPLAGSVVDRSISLCGPCSDARDRVKQKLSRSSWLRRHWVELTVMATVLGAIGFVVWRAWH